MIIQSLTYFQLLLMLLVLQCMALSVLNIIINYAS